MSVKQTMHDIFDSTRWFLREVSGESAYEKYVARMAIEHPGCSVLTEREFWKERADGAAVIARCC